MVDNSAKHFVSPRLRGVIPFLNHLLWRGYRGRGVAWNEVWSHLLLMDDELVVLKAVDPPSSVTLLSQQEEARVAQPLGGQDPWAVVPYDEIRRVALHATGRRAHVPRLLIDVHHAKVSWWAMDDRNHMWFDFSNLRHDPFDDAKVAHARALLPSVLPKDVKLIGF